MVAADLIQGALEFVPGRGLDKVPTGVGGLDDVLEGGFPRGRPTLICGAAGCGKTLLAMQFLCQGAIAHGEAGVYISFEESEQDLAANVASLGFDLEQLQADGLLALDHVRIEGQTLVETGEYDLDGLLMRIDAAVRKVGATRIVIDTVEVLFGALSDVSLVRSELKRLFDWLKAKGLTAVITAEQGAEGNISRYGIEEYVSDCVLVLDQRVTDELSTRRLRVLKYRGSVHGTNEYPFLISRRGITVLPITSLDLDFEVSTELIGTGIERLDSMLSGGVFRSSSILISGTSGSGKSTFAATFADAACRRGERTLYISYEEPPSQVIRNMTSVGLDLQQWVDLGMLSVQYVRPTLYGLERHLAHLQDLLDDVEPVVVVIDPVGSVHRSGTPHQVSSMVMRELDLLRQRGITIVMTALTHTVEQRVSELEISSLIDTWVVVKSVESNGERNRILSIIKSRGMAHSNQLTEFLVTEEGIDILEPYVGRSGVLTGSARINQQTADKATRQARSRVITEEQVLLQQRRAVVEAEVARLQADLAVDEGRLTQMAADSDSDVAQETANRDIIGRVRWATPANGQARGGSR